MVVSHGFDSTMLAFSSMGFSGFIFTIFLLFYTLNHGIVYNYLIVGLIGSIFNTLALVCNADALATGPAGPVQAISGSNAILLTIAQALLYLQMPKYFVIIGILIGFIGALDLLIPE